METEIRVLSPSDQLSILALEKKFSSSQESQGLHGLQESQELQELQELQKLDTRWELPQFADWHSSWREESLNHYLPLGWSFGLWDSDKFAPRLLGYFLAQPFLFLNGLTQTLWIEHLRAESLAIQDQLVDVALKFSREKHFQSVIFKSPLNESDFVKRLAPKFKKHEFPWISVSKMNL